MDIIVEPCILCIICTQWICIPELHHPGEIQSRWKSMPSLCFKRKSSRDEYKVACSQRVGLLEKKEQVEVEVFLIVRSWPIYLTLPAIAYEDIFLGGTICKAACHGKTKWDHPTKSILKYIMHMFRKCSRLLSQQPWVKSFWNSPFPVICWSFPAGVQRLSPGLAQSICWEKIKMKIS